MRHAPTGGRGFTRRQPGPWRPLVRWATCAVIAFAVGGAGVAGGAVGAVPAGASAPARGRPTANAALLTGGARPATNPGVRPSAPPAVTAVPPATSYVLVDVNTGNVLAGYHEHQRVRPASLTKILTALIAVGYLPAGATVPGTVQSLHAYPNIVGIQKGVGWPLKEVLGALLVYSANDAAYAIAQRISGSLVGFGPVMDQAARQIGMSDNPDFHDPAGLDGPYGVGGGNMVSARDLAIAGRDLLSVPQLAGIVTEQSYDFIDPTGTAHDLPSMDYLFLQSYAGAIGIKTGYTDRAGTCLMAAATRHGRTMLAVVMNGYNPTQTAIDLLNQGFATTAAAEPTSDHLPPVALPRPPLMKPAGDRAFSPRTVGRTGAGEHALASGATGVAVGVRGAPALPVGTGARGNNHDRGVRPSSSPPRAGLAAVVESWPGQTLLLLAGVGALLALWELVSTNRIYRRRRQALEYANGETSVMANFSSGRKRREQLIASYRRHERLDSWGRPSSLGRR